MVDNSDVHRAGPQGSGPLYERGEAGQKAAEEPVEIPRLGLRAQRRS